jgi:hypothetical protein
MSKRGASSGEMPAFPCPGRPGPELDELLLDMILNGQSLASDAPEEMHALAEMLASLPGPAEPGRLPGEAAARMAFARIVSPAGVSRRARPRARRRQSWVSAAAAAAAVGLGCAAAAYAGALLGPIQALASHAIGAPPAGHAPAARPAASQLCNAYQHAVIFGPAQAEAVAFLKLEKAAGGAGRIDVYCAVPEWRSVGSNETTASPAARPKPPGRTAAKSTPTPAPAPGVTPAPAPAPDPGPAPAPSTPTATTAPTATAALTPTPALTSDGHHGRRH